MHLKHYVAPAARKLHDADWSVRERLQGEPSRSKVLSTASEVQKRASRRDVLNTYCR